MLHDKEIHHDRSDEDEQAHPDDDEATQTDVGMLRLGSGIVQNRGTCAPQSWPTQPPKRCSESSTARRVSATVPSGGINLDVTPNGTNTPIASGRGTDSFFLDI
jgi:hypothetical protein